MAVETAEDLAQFFEADEFAVTATFTRGGSAVTAALVIFDDPSQGTQLYDAEVEEPAPSLSAPASSLAPVKRGDDVSVGGAGAFKVERIRRDGAGLVRLDLRTV